MHTGPTILEACVESLQEAIRAEALGASRLELCARLDLDGLSPDVELLSSVIAAVDIPVKVMLRPHGGSFTYSESDVLEIKSQLDVFRSFEIQGLVFGALKAGELDIQLINEIAQQAYPIPITVHKAIDDTPDIVASVGKLLDSFNIEAVLTSGGAPTALQGASIIRNMVSLSDGQINIIAAGKVTVQNRGKVQSLTNAVELHGRKIVGDLVPPQKH